MPRIGGTRNPSYRGNIVIDTYRGKLRVRSWPRKRGSKVHPNVAKQNEWFRDASQIIKFAAAHQQKIAIERSKGTGFYPRDMLMRAMAAGFFDIVDENDQLITPRPKRFEVMSFFGALTRIDTAQQTGVNTTYTIDWGLPVADAAGWWSISDPARLTVPADINFVLVTLGVRTATAFTGDWIAEINLNGSTPVARMDESGGGTHGVNLVTGPLPVVEGDYFTATIFSNTNADLDGDARTFFGVIPML